MTAVRHVSATPLVRSLSGLAGDSLVYVAATAVNAIVPFLAVPLLTRWLGPTDFGKLGTLMAMTNVAVLVVGLSTHAQISASYYREGPDSLSRRFPALFGVIALTALPLLIGTALWGRVIAARTGLLPHWLWAVWGSAATQFLVMATLSVWQVMRRKWLFAVTQLSLTILTTALTLLFAGPGQMGWTGRALGHLLGASTVAAVSIFQLNRTIRLEWHAREWPLRSALAFGLPVLPHSLAAVAMATMDRFALSTAGGVVLGHYFAALQVTSILSLGASALNQAWTPWMYSRLASRSEQHRREVVTATYVLGIGLCFAAGIAALFAGPVMRLFGGPAFEASASYLPLLAAAAAFSGMYYFFSGYFFFLGRTALLSTITVVAAFAQLSLTIGLKHLFAARGVAMASCLASLLYVLAVWVVAQRIFPMPWALRSSRRAETTSDQ